MIDERFSGGIDMRKLKRIFSCILAITTIIGGNVMSAQAVTGNNTKQETVKYAHELDAQAYDGNDLGATYSPASTVFKVWAPTATNVALKLYTTGSPDEEGAQNISTTEMVLGKNGVWSTLIKGDQKNKYYTYVVTVNGISTETADVYSKAVGVNGNRSMVVDLKSTDPAGWDKDQHVLLENPTDAIVWEVHVRDFSSSEISGVSLKHRGKYLAFTETGTTVGGEGDIPTCIDYLKRLGITHVQLMPVYDYATVDETQEQPEEYNWGYDPKNYNVPEGSYSTNAFDGNVRIREFKQMIKALHDAGIGVIMDVVYNHTYTAKGSCFENTVPGYYFRLDANGDFADASACGNETASDHLMYRKYMMDSILYWINEYHIDGFRFDLMGIHDVETMNLIRDAVDKQVKGGSKIIMYGEPWAASAVATDAKTCMKDNLKLLNNRIGAFNDSFRDSVKGHVFNAKDKGFVQDGNDKALVMDSIAGSKDTVNQPSQSIAYVSAHDNFTLYDKLILSTKDDESFDERDESIVSMNKLAAAITMTSQGINFMQAGEEFARTKFGDDNSFVSSDKINQLDWNKLLQFPDLVSYYEGLIEIRRNYKPFRDPTRGSAQKIAFSDTDKGVIAYTLENTLTKGSEWSYIAAVFNSNDEEAEVTLVQSGDTKLPEKWVIVADGTQAGLDKLGEIKGSKVTVPAKSAMILADSESFEKLALSSGKCTVNVEYKDADSGEVIKKQVIKGEAGGSYIVSRDNLLDIEYDYLETQGKEKGHFSHTPQTVTYLYKKFNGGIYTMNVKYVREYSGLLSTGTLDVAKTETIKMREGTEYSAPIKTVSGMKLDVSRFPADAFGTANKDLDLEYYYILADKADLVLHCFAAGAVPCVIVSRKTDEGTSVITENEKPAVMKKDDELGDGWYTLVLEGDGNLGSTYARFGENGVISDDSPEFAVSREVWFRDGELTGTGEVNVICMDNDWNVIGSNSIVGKEGEAYTDVQLSFENMKLTASTGNTSGVFGKVPQYAICIYEEMSIVENPQKRTGLILFISAFVAMIAAAVVGGIYSKRRNR